VEDAKRSTISFIRWAADWREFVVVVVNLSDREWPAYRVGLPAAGRYKTILNTDEARYGGAAQASSKRAGPDEIVAEEIPVSGRPFSAELALPPLTALYLKLAKPVTRT
jgi:1,4-alpha-glucan branching enzyme